MSGIVANHVNQVTTRLLIVCGTLVLLGIILAVCFVYPEGNSECKSIRRNENVVNGVWQMPTTVYPTQPQRPSLDLSIPLTEEKTLRLPTYERSSSQNTVTKPSLPLPYDGTPPYRSSWSVSK